MRVHSLVIVLAVVLVAVTVVFASVPNYINFQGTLTDTAGNPITGTRSMQFSLYDDTLSSAQLWDEFHPAVNISNGLFRVQLGSLVSLPPSLFDGRVFWLGILVGSDPQELTPRFPIVTTPYSFRSNNADVALNANLAFYALYSDTANYAHQAGVSAIASHAQTSDTSGYAYSAGISDDAIHSVYSDTAGVAYAAGWANDGLHAIYSDTANYVHTAAPDSDWEISGSNIYRLDGYVGIGTSAPSSSYIAPLLHLQRPFSCGIVIERTNTPVGTWQIGTGGNSTGSLDFAEVTSGNDIYMTIETDGKVGMGVLHPTSALDVEGDIQASGYIKSGNSITIDGDSATISGDSLKLVVWGDRALKIEPTNYSPNLIGGYKDNIVNFLTYGATIGGGGGSGNINRVSDNYGTIGGGYRNQAGDNTGSTYDAVAATVGGGYWNTAAASWATVGGGSSNDASFDYSTIAGGYLNETNDEFAFVGGGHHNNASGLKSVVAGGYYNEASGGYSVVGGGINNQASGWFATVAGGGHEQFQMGNVASNSGATVGGGQINEASGLFSTVGGGNNNSASGGDAVVAGGCDNVATGRRSAIPGGFDNEALGKYSFAAGQQAKAYHDGCFVWADSSNADFASTNINQFLIRASGGVGIGYTNPTHQLTVCSSSDDQTLRLIGPDVNGHGGKLNFGDDDYVYLDEDLDDKLTIRANRIGIMGGNVGIGTQAPDRLLHVYGNSNPRLLIESPSSNPELNLQRGTTTYALYVNAGNDLVFYQAGDRMKLTDGGDVGIGIGTPAYRLDVGGDVQCVQLHETSDLRFKTNIRTLNNALEKISKLRGVSFDWNREAESVGATPGDHQIGLVAQEVEQVIPELVSAPENGYKSVDYTKLTAMLIEAVKELKTENEMLKRRVESLETMNRY